MKVLLALYVFIVGAMFLYWYVCWLYELFGK